MDHSKHACCERTLSEKWLELNIKGKTVTSPLWDKKNKHRLKDSRIWKVSKGEFFGGERVQTWAQLPSSSSWC